MFVSGVRMITCVSKRSDAKFSEVVNNYAIHFNFRQRGDDQFIIILIYNGIFIITENVAKVRAGFGKD